MFVQRGSPGIYSNMQIGQTSIISQIDLEELQNLLGPAFKAEHRTLIQEMDFSSGIPVTLTANICMITNKENEDIEYKVCSSQFIKQIGFSQEIKGDGFFDGPLDDIGMKIINYCFANKEGSTIYINDNPSRVTKKDDGSIELLDNPN